MSFFLLSALIFSGDGGMVSAKGARCMKEKIRIYKRSSFFSDDFPFSIRHVINRTEDFNESKRFQREFWKITHIIRGEGELLLNEVRRPLRPGSLFLIHPGAVTTYSMSTPSLELCNLLFDPALIEHELAALKDDFHFFAIFSGTFSQNENLPLYLLDADHEIVMLLRSMEKEYEERPLNYRPLLKLKLVELLILMLRGGVRKMRAHRAAGIAEYVDQLLERHFPEEFHLEETAANIGISKSHLCRLYRAQTGRSIVERLKELRLSAAAGELRSSRSSISEICYRCGFNDLSYFYRAFRSRYADNPGTYRKKYGQF